jgi:hypothetical protein
MKRSESVGEQRARAHALARVRRQRIPWAAGSLGVLASIGIHVLLLEVVMMGYGSHIDHPRHKDGIGASAMPSDEEPRATLIFIDEPGINASREEPPESLASRGTVPQHLFLTVISPDAALEATLNHNEEAQDKRETPEEAAADQLGRAVLFGRYVGQIQARIERAWMRPRIPLAGSSFECHVQIVQSPRGDVLEVDVQQCNGDTPWQLSLVQAIEQASPLPAPPDPAVFSGSLRLSFHSNPYKAGGSEDGFEPRARALALASAAGAPSPKDPIAPPFISGASPGSDGQSGADDLPSEGSSPRVELTKSNRSSPAESPPTQPFGLTR